MVPITGGSRCQCPCCGQKLKGVFWGRAVPPWYQLQGAAGANAPAVGKNLRGILGESWSHMVPMAGDQPVPKPLLSAPDLKGYFGGDPFPYGTNDRGPTGAKAPTVGTKFMGYFGREPVQKPLLSAPT